MDEKQAACMKAIYDVERSIRQQDGGQVRALGEGLKKMGAAQFHVLLKSVEAARATPLPTLTLAQFSAAHHSLLDQRPQRLAVSLEDVLSTPVPPRQEPAK